MLISKKKDFKKEDYDYNEIMKNDSNIKMFADNIIDLIVKKYNNVLVYFYVPTNEVTLIYSKSMLIDIDNITSDTIHFSSRYYTYTYMVHNDIKEDIYKFLANIK